MLSALHDDLRSRIARRPPRSLKPEYQEFLLQRIEEYKNRVSRPELLETGDGAVRGLEKTPAGQSLPTEVLRPDHAGGTTPGRPRLPASPRWPSPPRALRPARREPTHWGIEPDGPRCAA